MSAKNGNKTAGRKAKTSKGKSASAVAVAPVRKEEEGPRWTFLTNHAHVLTVIDSEPNLVLRHVALRVGITERAVQRIIVDLEESGFLEITKVGRQNQYKVLKNQALRHPIEAHRSIGDLLKMLTG